MGPSVKNLIPGRNAKVISFNPQKHKQQIRPMTYNRG